MKKEPRCKHGVWSPDHCYSCDYEKEAEELRPAISHGDSLLHIMHTEKQISLLQSEINSLRQGKTIAQEGWLKALEENKKKDGLVKVLADACEFILEELTANDVDIPGYETLEEALKQHREERKGE